MCVRIYLMSEFTRLYPIKSRKEDSASIANGNIAESAKDKAEMYIGHFCSVFTKKESREYARICQFQLVHYVFPFTSKIGYSVLLVSIVKLISSC